MTPKQEERIRTKIKKIKAALAADKREWGGFYDDSAGLRYRPPELYVKLGDFTGGLRYMNWFDKNFPDDGGFPDFLFEWTIILFKRGRLKEAEKKAFQTFCSNTYIFDKFFDRPVKPYDMWEGSNFENPEFASNCFKYSHQLDELLDFAEWLKNLLQTERFKQFANKYIEIQKRLKKENDFEIRGYLIEQENKLVKEF